MTSSATMYFCVFTALVILGQEQIGVTGCLHKRIHRLWQRDSMNSSGPPGCCSRRTRRRARYHHPDYEEQRRRRASKGGKRGGRGRPAVELATLKERLTTLADDVLEGSMDRGDAAVVGQLLNTYIRAVSVELKVKEQLELLERVEEVERRLSANQQKGRKAW